VRTPMARMSFQDFEVLNDEIDDFINLRQKGCVFQNQKLEIMIGKQKQSRRFSRCSITASRSFGVSVANYVAIPMSLLYKLTHCKVLL
jgi:hypothetical protein